MGTKESAVSLRIFHQLYFILYSFAILCGVYIHLLRMFTYYRNKYILYILYFYEVNHIATVHVSKYQGFLFLHIFLHTVYSPYRHISEMRGVDHSVIYVPYADFILQEDLNF
jgi:hypothetical protein